MTVSLTQPAIGSTGWGASVNTNFQTIQDLLTRGLVNPIINGGFDFFQRQVPGTYTLINDNRYGPDRWRITRQTADIQSARFSGSGVSGLNSKSYGGFKQITGAGKFHISQWIENADTMSWLSRSVTIQVKLKATSSKIIRIALLELNSSGTADAVPATLVTTWGANGTNPTLATNVAIIGSSASCSVTTSFTTFVCAVTIPSNSKNIAFAIWTDSQFSANDELYVAEVGLYYGSTSETTNWYPRPTQQELTLCQRYYEKSYNIDVKPATVTNSGSIVFRSNSLSDSSFPYKQTKRVAATLGSAIDDLVAINLLSPNSGTRNFFYNGSGAADVAVVSDSTACSESGFNYYLSAAPAAASGISGHWTCSSEL